MDKHVLRRLLIGEFTLKRLVRSLIFIYTFFCLYVFFFADRMVFLPPAATYQDTPEILKLSTPDQFQISAIYLQNPTASSTILYSHGNAEDLGIILPVLHELQTIGFSVFAYDYRGYGTSQGRPSERNSYQDIQTAYNYLTQNLGVASQQIIVYGRSVGSGPTVNLASRQSVGGLILESAFTSLFRVVVPFPILPFDKFRNIDKIKNVNCPVLVMHGKADDTIPFSHGQQLFAAAPQPKRYLWVEEAGHNDLMWVAGERYAQALQKFAQLVE